MEQQYVNDEQRLRVIQQSQYDAIDSFNKPISFVVSDPPCFILLLDGRPVLIFEHQLLDNIPDTFLNQVCVDIREHCAALYGVLDQG